MPDTPHPEPPRDGRWLDIMLHLARGLLPLPPASPPSATPGPPASQPVAPQQQFQNVSWPGVRGCPFVLGRAQLAVVQVLLEAYREGSYDVREDLLVRAAKRAGSDCVRLRDVFRTSAAWGKLIVQGSGVGTYRLPPLPEEGGD